jgi:N-acetylneuraminic acid mutarotase
MGGLSSGGPITGSAIVERYDPQIGAWTQLPDLPVATDHTAAAATEAGIFIFGGTFAVPSTRAYRFDLARATWDPVMALPEPRAAAGAAFLDGRVYLVGGFGSDRKELVPAYSYDPSSDRWERIPDLPTPREHLAVVAYRGSICALGGHFGQADQTAIVECYDPSSRRWSSLPSLIHPTSDFAAVVSGTEIWTVGDYVQVFDGSRWWIGPQLGTPRFGVAAAVLDHTLYVIGGAARTPASAGMVESLDLPK